MKLETFFEKFDLFADAPDAVARMRELVLELAVRGQLSERMPEDQDDPAWRAFIKEFDNRIYGSDPGPPPPFNIPDEWRWVCLDDVGTTKVRNDVDDATSVSFVPMALISATYGVPVQSEKRTWGEIKKGFTHFADNDVVLAKITPCFENAKSAVMRNLINGVGAGTTELHVFRSTTKVILPDYVLLYIKTRGFISRGESRMTGSAGQKRVPREYFANSPFTLPPLAEQKRIVAKVDELMALCDRLEAQQQERETRHAALARASLTRFAAAPTPANLNLIFHPSYTVSPADLRKAILTLAVQGKLVPQDPNEGTGDEVLSTLRERNHESKTKSASSYANEKDTLPLSIPSSWAVSRLGQIYDSSFYGPRFGKEEYVSEGGIPTIRTTDMTPRGQIVLRDPPLVRVDDPKKLALYAVRPNDLLLTRSGTIGMMAVFKEDYVAIPSAYLIRFRFPREVLADFYYLFLGSPHGNDLLGLSLRSIGVPNVNATSISNFIAPLPPLAEQRRIVAKVEQLMALVDALETQLAAGRATASKLLSALVAELTGTKSNGKVSKPAGTGRRGRPRKS